MSKRTRSRPLDGSSAPPVRMARSAEQLSSALDRAAVSAAQERARNCRATAGIPAPETPAPQRTGEESERPDIANRFDWDTFKAKLS